MSTDFQQGRVALGARLRELRGDLTGRRLADTLGWPQSKVSKLETGRQTATETDLRAWAEATGHPETADELVALLRGVESRSRSWRRQLAAGHRPVQDTLAVEYQRSRRMRAWQPAMVVGMLQTAEYARAVFSRYADLHQSVRDIDDAVRARVRRQEELYNPARHYEIVLWEAALHAVLCPPSVMAGQLDRLSGVLGMDTVRLGIVPFGAQLDIPPANGFWMYDDRLVIVEDWHAELWLDDADTVALYSRVWETVTGPAVYGAGAHRLISRARAQLGLHGQA
ncbi:helix-turn-helix domain-containing protein [Streptomyces albus]|uniref:helix-turn-helix domain-containing protein n=1 Tax=Streptomyces TaxID=1883 RepID=UPI0013B48207|nr:MULTISPECIES: helix-turn-helix transcriptional regulator [Streptomyces]MDI6407406.1 helix-turn-helix transcriptional regulator [Streptomyces albus]QID35774.1 helix-turn-helix domain-containing protein [Streptomyces albus]